MTPKTIGILGGGPISRMLAVAATPLGFKTHIYSPEENCPAFDVSRFNTHKPFDDREALQQFASSVDLIICESADIPLKTLKLLSELVPVHPRWQTIQIARNRIKEKQLLKQLEINTAVFEEVNSLQDLLDSYERMGTDCLLKGIEGKGYWWIDDNSNLEAMWQVFDAEKGVLEAFVPFQSELSITVARNERGQRAAYALSENIHKDGTVIETFAPARIDSEIANQALEIATLIAEALQVVGLLTVKFFYTDEDELLVQGIDPFPHDSSHWTLDGSYTDQFEQCIRAVTGLSLGDSTQHTPVRMVNLTGEGMLDAMRHLNNPRAKVHLYGSHGNGKIGHVNLI